MSKDEKSVQDQVKESILVRGVCAALQKMTLPSINNLLDLFSKIGINLKRQ